jgi:hypothetical protein
MKQRPVFPLQSTLQGLYLVLALLSESSLGGFLVSGDSAEYISRVRLMYPTLQGIDYADLPTQSLFVLSTASIRRVSVSFCVTPSLKRLKWCRNI